MVSCRCYRHLVVLRPQPIRLSFVVSLSPLPPGTCNFSELICTKHKRRNQYCLMVSRFSSRLVAAETRREISRDCLVSWASRRDNLISRGGLEIETGWNSTTDNITIDRLILFNLLHYCVIIYAIMYKISTRLLVSCYVLRSRFTYII